MSRVIRIDSEVKRILDNERRPDERNYNDAIMRLARRKQARPPKPDPALVKTIEIP